MIYIFLVINFIYFALYIWEISTTCVKVRSNNMDLCEINYDNFAGNYIFLPPMTQKTSSSTISIEKELILRSPFYGVTFTIGHDGFVKLNLIWKVDLCAMPCSSYAETVPRFLITSPDLFLPFYDSHLSRAS